MDYNEKLTILLMFGLFSSKDCFLEERNVTLKWITVFQTQQW